MTDAPPRPVLSDDEVVTYAREAVQLAREETRRVDTDEAPKELQKPGITIDLGHKGINSLPEEVIDIIKDEIERLALSHNQLAQLPPRLSECHRLRYLNVRYNAMRELPPPVLQLFSLEILDISKNRIKVLPDEIANLTSLKVFAIQRNKIEKLPLCLGDIGSLQVLKLDGNPIVFPPPEICKIRDDTLKPSNENEKDAVITSQVKRYLRQQSTRERLRIESEGESSEGNVETPRPPRRMMSGRFPVKPSISGLDTFDTLRPDSPGIPPVPRAHYRGQSQQGNGGRRPVISPLLISNERNRSQSDGGSSATLRAKRGGLVIKNVSELGNVDEVRMKLSDHTRNISQGSTASGMTSSGAATPSTSSSYQSEGISQRTLMNRPLSDLLEHKRRSRAPDVVVEAAKTVLYALHQLHGPVLHVLQKTRFSRMDNGVERGMQLQRRVRDSSVLIRSLGMHLQKFDTLAEEDDEDATTLSAIIRDNLIRSLTIYLLLFQSISESLKEINRDADPRLIRTLLLLGQGSTVEIRNACTVLGVDFALPPIALTPKYSGLTLTNNSSVSSGSSLPLPMPYQGRGKFNGNAYQPSVPATPVSAQPEVLINGSYESPQNTMHGANAVTPRSGESFATLSNRHNHYPSDQDFEEEARFEKIFLKLKNATHHVNKILPSCRHYFHNAKRTPSDSYNDPYQGRSQVLVDLVHKSDDIIACSNALSQRLSNIVLRDAAARNQQDFWQHSTNFCKLWSEFATIVIEASSARIVSGDLRKIMKPIHRAFKDVSVEINSSPWSHLALQFQSNSQLIPPLPISSSNLSSANGSVYTPSRPGTSLSMAPHNTHVSSGSIPNPINTSIATMTGANSQNGLAASLATPVPATPLSAALGAAAQATMPKHPSHALSISSQNSTSSIPTMPMQAGFPGTSVVFERADRLLSNTQRRI